MQITTLSKLSLLLMTSIVPAYGNTWYSTNPDAWLAGLEATERARERAASGTQEKKVVPELQDTVNQQQIDDQYASRANLYLKSYPLAGGKVSSTFGIRQHPIIAKNAHHNGVDIAAPEGTPFKAVEHGVVTRANYSSSFGNVIEIDHGNRQVTRYAHAKRLKVSAGDQVKKGDVIGLVGSTGQATGPHLHFELINGGVQVQPLDLDQRYSNELLAQKTEPESIAKITESHPQFTDIPELDPAKTDLLVEETKLSIMLITDKVSLWEIAKSIKGDASIYQALLALYKLNPGIFINDNINLRKAGKYEIVLPDNEFIIAMDRKEGLAKMAADNKSISQRHA